MERNNNNTPPFAEEIIIERTAEEEIADLREKLKVLQDELAEKEEENEELDRLVWEGIEKLEKERKEKKDLKTKLNDSKTKLLGSLFGNKKKSKKIDSLKNRMSNLETNKDQQIDNLKEQLKREKKQADNLQAELNRERSWWDKWINDDINSFFPPNGIPGEYYWDDTLEISYTGLTPDSQTVKNRLSFGVWIQVYNSYLQKWKKVSPNVTDPEQKARTIRCRTLVKHICEYYKNKE